MAIVQLLTNEFMVTTQKFRCYSLVSSNYEQQLHYQKG
jgi:hypothetical protein